MKPARTGSGVPGRSTGGVLLKPARVLLGACCSQMLLAPLLSATHQLSRAAGFWLLNRTS